MSELSVDIVANTQAAVSNVKKLGSSFEETATDMEKLVDAGDQIGKSADDIASDLKRAGDGRPFDEIRDEIKRADDALDNLGDSARRAGDDARDGMDRAKGGVEDFKSEAKQSASEAAASFDGSAESIGDAFQEVAATAFAGFGPAGLAAGGAAAFGIGAITERLSEISERSKETTDGIIADFVELGDALDAEAVNSRVQEIVKVEETRKQAELLGELLDVEVGQAALAMAGDFEAAGVTVEDVMQAIANAPGNVDFNTWVDLKSTLDATNTGLEYGAQAASWAADAMDRKARSDLEAAIATGQVTEEVDHLNNVVYTLPDGKQIMISAETGQATTDVSTFKGDVDGMKDKTVTIRTRVDSSAWDNYTPAAKTAIVRQRLEGLWNGEG